MPLLFKLCSSWKVGIDKTSFSFGFKMTMLNLSFVVALLLVPIECHLIIEFGEDFKEQENNEITLNVDVSIPKDEMSFCIQVYIERFGVTLLFYHPDFFFTIEYLEDNVAEIVQKYFGKDYYKRQQNVNFQTHEWTTICASINESSDSLALAINGKLIWINARNVGVTTTNPNISSVVFGSQGNMFRRKGKVTNFYIWPTKMTSQALIESSKQCDSLISTGVRSDALLKWNSLKIEQFSYTGSLIKIRNTSASEQCEKFTNIEQFEAFLPFQSAVDFCEALGSQVVMPKSETDLAILRNLTQYETWIPVVYLQDEWINYYTKEDVEFLPWAPGEPNGKDQEPCVHTTWSGTRFNDNLCQQTRNVVCQFENPVIRYQLRGHKGLRNEFVYESNARYKNHVLFKTMDYSDYKIYFEDTEKSWIISQNFRENPNNTFASFKVENSNEDLPIGVKEWVIKSSDQTKRVNLEFTKVVFSR